MNSLFDFFPSQRIILRTQRALLVGSRDAGKSEFVTFNKSKKIKLWVLTKIRGEHYGKKKKKMFLLELNITCSEIVAYFW